MTPAAKQRRDAKHAAQQAAKELVLPMGEPGQCFQNAIRAVIADPKRLRYVEGFVVRSCDDETVFTHHGWVKDVKTGKRHEVTYDFGVDAIYIGIEFTRDELIEPLDGTLLKDADCWTNQLSMQYEHDLLVREGYDVVLTKQHPDGREGVVSLESINLAYSEALTYHTSFEAEYLDGWMLRWTAQTAATA